MASHQKGDLEQLRALPLEAKERLTKARIQQWLDHYDGMAYVSFSGGKDSTVLAHLVHQVDPTVPLVFSNTGLEYAGIQSFARKMGAEFIRPEMRFDEVIRTYGYPIISKEVSEAIYYARRIRNGSAQRERERENSRAEKNGVTRKQREDGTISTGGGGQYRVRNALQGHLSMDERQNQLRKQEYHSGKPYGNEAKFRDFGNHTVREQKHTFPFSPGTGENDADRISAEDVSVRENGHLYDSQGVYQGGKWTILMGGFPMNPNEQPVTEWKDWRRGCLSKPTQQFGTKSLFNKEKWLPAARDLPFKISHYCCMKMKKLPMHKYASQSKRYPIIGTLAEESRIRKQAWIRHGCNAFDGNNPSSQPLSFWTNQDILHYIKKYNLEIAPPYGDVCYTDPFGMDVAESLDFLDELHCTGCERTGCVYCLFGAHNEKKPRLLELKQLAPRQYEYAMGGGQWIDNPDYDPDAPEYDGEWKNWNPEKIWVPSKEGLGLKFVIDEFNKLYPKNQIKY